MHFPTGDNHRQGPSRAVILGSDLKTGARLALAAVLIVPAVVAAAAQPTRRHFLMGFTPFPHDMTVPAIKAVDRFVRDNGDIIAVHLEGVPWLEANTEKPFHKKMLDNWQRLRNARDAQGKLFLALTPINNDRSDLAAYRSDREGLPMPEPFVGKGFNDPIVMDAYLAYCRRAVRYFKPDYLAVGIEVNELYHKARGKWPAYVRLHRHVYKALKQDNPKLPIFVTFALHNMLNADWADRRATITAAKKLMAYSDVVGVSYYPIMAKLTGKTNQSFRWLVREFAGSGKPFAVTRTGQPAEPVVLSRHKITFPASEKAQQLMLSKLLSFAHVARVEFVVWFIPRDFDDLWAKMKNTAPEFMKLWRDCGLLDGQGKERAAYRLWQKVHKLPYQPRPAAAPRR